MASTHSVDEPRSVTDSVATEPIRVLYIGGEGRSGSTVLEKALAAHPEVVAVGELKYLWRWGIRRNELCACGNPVPKCEFWSAVGERLFGPGGFASPEAVTVLEEYERTAANRRMLASFLTPVLPSSRRRLARVRKFLGRLYAAIAAEAGASVVVDASKHPMHLSVAYRADGVDMAVVQLVRNPCGVTNSWSKKVSLPHDPTGTRTMGPHPAAMVVPRWALMNLAVQYIRWFRDGAVIRYEDFCRHPKETIATILRLADLDPTLVPDTGTEAIALTAGHGIAGNPARFGADEITVKEDTAWRSNVPRLKQLAIKAAVLPQVIQYRYLSRD